MGKFNLYLKQIGEEWTEYDINSQIGEVAWKIERIAKLSNVDIHDVFEKIKSKLFGGI